MRYEALFLFLHTFNLVSSQRKSIRVSFLAFTDERRNLTQKAFHSGLIDHREFPRSVIGANTLSYCENTLINEHRDLLLPASSLFVKKRANLFFQIAAAGRRFCILVLIAQTLFLVWRSSGFDAL